MPKSGGSNSFATPQIFKGERVITPSSYAHEVMLVKLELSTPTEHPSSPRSGFLVGFVLLNLQFSVYS